MIKYQELIDGIINKFIKDHPEIDVTYDKIINQLYINYKNERLEINSYLKYTEDWRSRKGFKTDKSNIPEKLMLIVTELAEAAEADRKDDEIGFQEELADTYIRLMDLSGSLGYDVDIAIRTKMACNEFRPARHGKKY